MTKEEIRYELAENNWNMFYGCLVPSEVGYVEKELIKYGFDAGYKLAQAEIEELKAYAQKLVESLERLSKTGDGSHDDRRASFYNCLPTLQIEFSERIGFAKEALAEWNKKRGGK